MTGDGFLKFHPTLPIGTVDGTQTVALFIVTSEDTVATIDNACDKFARAVGIDHTLLTNHLLGLRREFVPQPFSSNFELRHLVGIDRRTSIPFFTTAAMANGEVTAKLTSEEFKCY